MLPFDNEAVSSKLNILSSFAQVSSSHPVGGMLAQRLAVWRCDTNPEIWCTIFQSIGFLDDTTGRLAFKPALDSQERPQPWMISRG